MDFPEELNELIDELVKHWNIAEKRIKQAEQVNGQEIVAPAIFELRYAGRKMIDVFELLLNKKNEHIAKDSSILIADAIEDCVKAKHDAIDSMLHGLVIAIDGLEKSVGVDIILKYFPDYINAISDIMEINNLISESRESRLQGREDIYDHIDNDKMDKIYKYFNSLKSMTPKMFQEHMDREKANREQEEKYNKAQKLQKRFMIISIVTAIFALLSVAVNIAMYVKM